MLETLRKIFPPTHRHSQCLPWEWQQPFDPMLADLKDFEHGIVRHISSEAVTRNGLVLSYDGDGAANVRVN